MKSKMNIKSIIILAIISIVSMFFINISLAANTATIIVETANLREANSTDSKILELINLNEKVEIVEKTGDWYKVKYKGITGYLYKEIISVDGQEQEEKELNENTQDNNTQQKVDKELENTVETENVVNQEGAVETDSTPVVEQEENATEIENEKARNGKHKLIKSEELKITPLINSITIMNLDNEENVNVVETINDWARVETKNNCGWLRYENLQKVDITNSSLESSKEEENKTQQLEDKEEEKQPESKEEPKVEEQVTKTRYINVEAANLRQKPDTASEVLQSLTINTSVTVLSESNGWSKVKVDGKEGYVSTRLLSDTQTQTSRGNQTPRSTENVNQEATSSETSKNVENANNQNNANNQVLAVASTKGAEVVEYAKKYIGSKYVYGGTTPSGFDCSGFTSYVYKNFGVSINRTAATQYSNGTSVSKSNLQAGDLVMFGKSGINHVGIYIGGGMMVHAANSSRGVTTDTINSGYYCTNYVGARRIFN